MIAHLQMITIYVSDLDQALDFYTNKLGFVKTGAYDDGEGEKLYWVVPKPAQNIKLATEIGLYQPDAGDPRVGAVSGVVFSSPDIEKTYHELKEKGVHFTMEIIRHSYGEGEGDLEARFTDPDGNEFLLHT